MVKQFIISLKISLFTILVTGIIYPFLITGLSYVFFYKKATGSLIFDEQKKIIGSELIGQTFHNPSYFFSRPSDAGKGYDGTRSGGANFSPTSQQFVQKVEERVGKIKSFNTAPIPIDLVTSSASGLDAHISLSAAYWQAPRIALYRDVSLKRVIAIIDEQIEFPQFYVLGKSRLNVLKLNLALDRFFGFVKEDK